MTYRTRTYYSDSQKALMWERWRQGQTLHQIAALFDRPHTSVQGILARHGGIRPPERRRAVAVLRLGEREEISRALAEGQSIRSIAARRAGVPYRLGAWEFAVSTPIPSIARKPSWMLDFALETYRQLENRPDGKFPQGTRHNTFTVRFTVRLKGIMRSGRRAA